MVKRNLVLTLELVVAAGVSGDLSRCRRELSLVLLKPQAIRLAQP